MVDTLQVFGGHVDKRLTKVEKKLERYDEHQKAVYEEMQQKLQAQENHWNCLQEFIDNCDRERRKSYERIVENATENERTTHGVARKVKNIDSRVKDLETEVNELTKQLRGATLKPAAQPQQQHQH